MKKNIMKAEKINMAELITISTTNSTKLANNIVYKNDLSYIADDIINWYNDVVTINGKYNEPEPKYKLRKCECCGGPLKGTTCGWCGAEYEVYY